MFSFIRVLTLLALCLATVACSNLPGATMANAAAWCVEVDVTGRWTVTDAAGRYLGVSDAALLQNASMEDVLALADRLCRW